MLLDEFLANKNNVHREQGNPSVKCNALYKTTNNLNCYLTASQAMEFAQHLLAKAKIILDNDLENAAIHIWNQGSDNEKIFFGLNKSRIGTKKRKKALPKIE